MYPAGVPDTSIHTVTLKNGVSVRVVESGPMKEDAVLLVHGWGGNVYSFAETIPALAAAGHRAIAFDLPGHGLSDKPTDESVYSTKSMSGAVMEVANAMGVRRFSFVGHSMGGSFGLDLATRGERRLERLVLINATGLGSVPIIRPLRVFSPLLVNRLTPQMLTRPLITLVLRVAFGTPERPTPRDVDEYWAPTQFDEFAWACRACIHRATWRRTAATKLSSLRLPVLVITGGHDRVVRGTAARARLIPAARVVPIREGGHLVMQECAARVNSEILHFLAGTRPR